jgi:hypothetical protein
MNWNRAINGALCGSMTILLGMAGVARAASTSTKTDIESRGAARLLQDIRADAMKVRSAASELEHLTKDSSATWLEYDRQWNEIKPAQEDMEIKLWRLESMQAKLSPIDAKELEQSKPMIEQIQHRTRELRALLDEPGIQTTNVQFKAFASSLTSEAGKLEHAASAS